MGRGIFGCAAAMAMLLMLGIRPLNSGSPSRFVKLHHLALGADGRMCHGAKALGLGATAIRGFSRGLEEIAAKEFQEAVEAWQQQNLMPAIQLFKRSAQKGNEVGEYCFRWGQYHELPPSDFAQAQRWYRRGARLLHKASTTALGKLYYAMGNHALARQWLLHTAKPQGPGGERGDSLAQWFMAESHLKSGAAASQGRGLRIAVRWWKRSAENGDTDAMLRLSEVFSIGGAGIPKESMRSRHWLFAAAAHGHQNALSNVNWNIPDRPAVEQRWIDDMERHGWV